MPPTMQAPYSALGDRVEAARTKSTAETQLAPISAFQQPDTDPCRLMKPSSVHVTLSRNGIHDAPYQYGYLPSYAPQ
jgi:hypothetical protein